MGTIFDDLGVKITKTAEMVSNKAGDVVEITRIRSLRHNLKQKNQEELLVLGKMVYEKFKEGNELNKQINEICEGIKEREVSISKYTEMISAVKGEHLCAECGRYSSKDTAFCPFCGNPFPVEEKAEEDAQDDDVEKIDDEMVEVVDDEEEEAPVKSAAELKEKAEDLMGDLKDKAEDLADKAKEKAADMAVKTKDKIVETAETVCDKMTEKLDD